MQVQHSKTTVAERSAAVEVAAAGTQCRNVTVEEPCYRHLLWAMKQGIYEHPEWYPGLTPNSHWDDFQQVLHYKDSSNCPEPCGQQRPPDVPDVITQEGALVPAGGEIRFYFVGTSNVLWETWPDQVHAMLKRLGYAVPSEDFRVASVKRPTHAPTCDDASEYAELDTPRIGRLGWSSWGFAFDSDADCDDRGFRKILGHNVSCTNAWSCNPAWKGAVVRPSEVGEEAQRSHVVVLSNWINDCKQRYSQYVCFGGEVVDEMASTRLTIFSLRKLIQAIHARNPNVRIGIMALYPDARGVHMNENVLPRIAAINDAVEAGVVRLESNTFFVRYDFPEHEEIYQVMHGGHPNCRGDRVMATAVIEALFREKIVARSFALDDSERCLGRNTCGALSAACCRRSALCYVKADGVCAPYGPGRQ